MKRGRVLIACFLALELGFAPASTTPSGPPLQPAELGHIQFANSCSPEVQKDFNAAVAMLHSFQYGFAEKTFLNVAGRDPQCAIAYWGAAMTLYHQLWDWPTAEALHKGREYLEKARRLKKTERESAFLDAAMAFYQPEPALRKSSRVQAYSAAMLKMHQRYPQDADATAFYALSLLTLPSQDNDSNQRKAIRILQRLFEEQPDHPGAAHYLIHAADTPEFARLGLPAALRYAEIAPASPHALHMPSHIFARLGMWQESIASNLASLSAAEEVTKSQRDDGSGDALHATMYLAYSYLQAGQEEDARRLAERVATIQGATPAGIANNVSILEALYAVETQDWKQAATLTVRPDAFPYARIRTFWARAIGAARIGDISAARKNIEKLNQARASSLAYMRSVDHQMHMGASGNPDVSVQQLEAEAWLTWAEGKPAEALALMRTAAGEEECFGVESRSVPAYEMLGDLLLELHQPESALVAYTAALAESPGRFNSVAGAARASRAAGNREKAKFYYAMLIQCCSPATKRTELGEAKLFLSGN